MAHDVFISHSSKDKICADALCATLEKHNVRCWVAPRDILPGSDYGSAIVEGIKASKVMILIFSSNSNESAHVKREVERAVNHGIIIVPFKIEDVALSSTMEYFVSGTHWLDAIDPPFENHLKSVTKYVCILINKPMPHEIDSESGVLSAESEHDVLYDEIVMYVIKSRKSSISSVQRQFKIGYIRAATIFEAMVQKGIVSQADSNGSRIVLAPPLIID